MKLTNILVVAIIGAAGYQAWHRHKAAAEEVDNTPSAGAFVSVEMPDGAQRNKVVILAPLNCPSDAAKRADALSARLTEMGIPNERSNTYALHYNTTSAETQVRIRHTQDVLGGKIPAVFVNGLGKDNPSADEVVAVYRSSQ